MRSTPVDVQNAVVAKLRAIPELVVELNSDPARVMAYYDLYPDNVSLADALYHLPAPGVVVAWQGVTIANFGAATHWAHQVTVYLRSGNDVPEPLHSLGRMVMALLHGEPEGTGQPLIYQNSGSWVAGRHMELRELPTVQRAQDAEGKDYFEMPLLLAEIG